jgi:hypothetical protein
MNNQTNQDIMEPTWYVMATAAEGPIGGVYLLRKNGQPAGVRLSERPGPEARAFKTREGAVRRAEVEARENPAWRWSVVAW